MTTAIDTNVLISLWDQEDTLNMAARAALDNAQGRGGLVIAAPVFAELMAFPGRSESFLDSFLTNTGITVHWELGESVWRRAGQAFQSYARRRGKPRNDSPRRILADFLIGAHALENGFTLLTMDAGLYRASFPRLMIAPF